MSKFLKSLCKIAIPVTLQSMLQSSFSIVDQIMIGQLGETNISAVGLCGNFSLIFSVMIGAVSTVAGILIAQFIGAEESKEAWCSFDVSLIIFFPTKPFADHHTGSRRQSTKCPYDKRLYRTGKCIGCKV